MLTKFASAKKYLLDFAFPPRCVNCKSDGNFLCHDCEEDIPVKRIQTCPICHKHSAIGKVCDPCKLQNKDLRLDGLLVGTQYANNTSVQKLIKSLKYKYAIDLIPYLGNILTTIAFHNLKPLPWNKHIDFTSSRPINIISPIPLHFLRKWQRGFNQSEHLSNFVHTKLKIHLTPILNRVKRTKMQSTLNKTDRVKNIKSAFSLDKNFQSTFHNNFEEKKTTIILIDDVATTLSTLNECAKIIKSTFPDIQVIGLVVARG